MKTQALIITTALIAVLWFGTGLNPLEQVEAMYYAADDKLNRGPKVMEFTPSYDEIKAGSLVDQLPAHLAAAWAEALTEYVGEEIAIPVEVAIMATVIRSEMSIGAPQAEREIIAWTLKNDATKNFGGNYAKAAMGNRGKFGRQKGVRFSTAKAPYKSDIMIALGVYSGEYPDRTGGAHLFVHPKGFKTTEDYEAVEAARLEAGNQKITFTEAPQIVVYRA